MPPQAGVELGQDQTQSKLSSSTGPPVNSIGSSFDRCHTPGAGMDPLWIAGQSTRPVASLQNKLTWPFQLDIRIAAAVVSGRRIARGIA